MNKNNSGQSLTQQNKASFKAQLYKYRYFYLMFLPVMIFALIFFYIPMVGVLYSFTSYKGIRAPEFVGLANFRKMFQMPNFWSAFRNTLEISVVKLFLNTAIAIIISLLLNEMTNLRYKKITQTVIYLPHFLSWVVTASVFSLIMSPSNEGLINQLLLNLHIIEKGNEIYFLGNQNLWRMSYYIINIWKDSGWGTVIFLATLSGINPCLYEAAAIDGANRFKRMTAVTLPALSNTIITVLILNLAKIMNLFESAFVLQNDAVMGTANVLQTYIYYQTFNSGAIPDYGYTTAVGLFKSIVGCILVLTCNHISKKTREGRGIV